jgi:cytochrome P450
MDSPIAGDRPYADDYDPFDEFNRAMGAESVLSPYPDFVGLRRAGHVHEGVVGMLAGGAVIDAEEGGPPVWTACSFDAVQEVLKDGETFSSSAYSEVIGKVLGRSILEMDEPEHHPHRALLQQAFTRKSMERWEAELVVPIVDGLIVEFVDDGHAELVRALTLPFPVMVIAALLGLPDDELPRFHRLAVELIGVSVDMDRAMAASKLLRDLFAIVLAERREAPADDMISTLAHIEKDGEKLTDEEIFSFLRLLLPAGAETTYRSSSNLLFGLLTHTEQLDALRADRSLMGAAIEEGLRWEPPLLTIVRTATRDTEVLGIAIEAGSAVIVNLGAANHDENRWDDAESFDIFRRTRPHIGFAHGPHMCLGMHLARMETKVVVDAVLDRLPNLALDDAAAEHYITGMTFRSPPHLHVTWG